MLKKIGRGLLYTICGLLGLIVLIIIALYIPPIQQTIVRTVVAGINKSPGTELSIEKFRLTPPMRLSVEGVQYIQDGDTIASVRSARVKISLSHLLKGEVKASLVKIEDTRLKIGHPDSAMYLTTDLGIAEIDDAAVGLASKRITIDRIALGESGLFMQLIPDDTPEEDTTPSAPMPWQLDINQIRVSDLTYRMTTRGSIDSLGVTIPDADINSVTADMTAKKVRVASFAVDSLSAAFLTPFQAAAPADSSYIQDINATIDTIPDTSSPWAISVDAIRITATEALYGIYGAEPVPGLDLNHLRLSDVTIEVDSLLSHGSTMHVPVKKLSARERCGLDMTLSGLYYMDADSMSASDIDLHTQFSHLGINASMGMGQPGLPSPVDIKCSGYISPVDIEMVVPSMKYTLSGVPRGDVLNVDIDITGHGDIYDVNTLALELPECFTIGAEGSVANPTGIERMEGGLKLSGRIYDSKFLEPTLDGGLEVPPLLLKGNVRMHAGLISGKLDAVTPGGRLALDADWQARAQGYDLSLKADSFPVNSFMPALEVEKITADLTVKGRGYDFFNPKTSADITANVSEASYLHKIYRDIRLNASVADGNAQLQASSPNPAAQFILRASGNLTGSTYDWHLDADVANLDLRQMGLTDSTMQGNVALTGDLSLTPAARLHHGNIINGHLDIASLDWTMGQNHFATTSLDADFMTADSVTSAVIKNHDLDAGLTFPMPLDSVMARLSATANVIDSVTANRSIDILKLQRALPPLRFDFHAGEYNILSNYLEDRDMDFTLANLQMTNDSLFSLDGRLLNLTKGATVIDTLDISARQKADKLLYDIHIGNRPGTLDDFASVTAYGEIDADHAEIILDQQNIEGKTGYHLGLLARFFDDWLTVKVIPSNPVIGYKDWTVNDSNYVALNMVTQHLDANLLMKSAESTINLYTDHSELTDSAAQEDVILKIKNIKLQEWIAVNPYAPPVSGNLSADMRFGWNDREIGGKGFASIGDLTYGKERVGSFDLDLGLTTDSRGTVRAAATLMVDSIKTVTAIGNLNDTTATHPFLLDFKMIHFPLTVLNPFLPPDKARLTGTLNGNMDITGSLAEPVFNGFLDFDETTLLVPMLGTTYRFSDAKLPVDSNVVKINDFKIYGANNNPLMLNGVVDARHIHDITIDLDAKASDMQVVGSKKGRDVQIVGKAFINLAAGLHGGLSHMDITADLSLLPATNVTYVMGGTSRPGNLSSQSTGDVVKFVNFNDSVAVAEADTVPSAGMMTSISAILRIQAGSTINVDLSPSGKDRIQLQPSGILDYGSNYMGDARLTGRLNVDKGFVRYSPPLMSEKNFSFQPGSYVAFSGDVANPYINIKAIDVLRANVEQEGQNSRLINFDVILNLTNTLDNINVSFDLDTKDDITVANELRSMTPEQRANQAMNLLLYNVYAGPGTKASASLSGNPLYSFLESQVNSWAANNIKGVDLSFGIDQYDRTVDGASSTATSYSYKMSKSLFNDRFKISVGGNYATEDDRNQNLSQNLINDISFEYYITPSGSMYIKIFRHTGYESILEGEVTQTGVGFVYKRKLRRLGDLFRPLNYFRRRAHNNVTQETDKN